MCTGGIFFGISRYAGECRRLDVECAEEDVVDAWRWGIVLL